MHAAYDHLAEWFEYLNDDCDYPKWSQYFIDGLARLGAGKCGLEMGCGSGRFCRALTRAGYTMTGADRSCAMLDAAQRRAAEEGVSVTFLQADAANFSSPVKFDFLIAPNDCYNYLPPARIPAAFRHAASVLKRGGIFWFDVSSEYKLRRKVADNIFADDREDVTYLCFSKAEEDRVRLDVTLFVRGEDGRFTRYDEQHVQYIHTGERLTRALAEAGFEVLSAEGHLGEDKAESDRLNLICRKI